MILYAVAVAATTFHKNKYVPLGVLSSFVLVVEYIRLNTEVEQYTVYHVMQNTIVRAYKSNDTRRTLSQ